MDSARRLTGDASELVDNLLLWGRPDETDHEDADTRVRRELCEHAAKALAAAYLRITTLEQQRSDLIATTAERLASLESQRDELSRALDAAITERDGAFAQVDGMKSQCAQRDREIVGALAHAHGGMAFAHTACPSLVGDFDAIVAKLNAALRPAEASHD